MAGKATIYDYVITSVSNPNFERKIEMMVQNILDAGGTCPTFVTRTRNGAAIPDTDPVEYEQESFAGTDPMVGTKASNGKIQLHFRLSHFLSETEVIDMLETGMDNPKPPLSVSALQSGFKNVYVSDGLDGEGNAIGHYEYDVVVQASKGTFLPFMPDVVDYYDGNGAPVMRPPNAGDTLHLSAYGFSEPIELI